MNTRMDPGILHIGTYRFGECAHTEQHVRDLRDCGIDFVIDFLTSHIYRNKPLLDLFSQYNIGLIAGGVIPLWVGGNGSNAGTMAQTNPVKRFSDVADGFADHPAVWGLDCGDEPSALDFPHLGKVFDTVNRGFARQFPYTVLYPNYAQVAQNDSARAISQLGTATYREYVERYCDSVDCDFLSYDHYVYSTRNLPLYYENQRVVADACRKTGRAMWITLQVNSAPARREERLSLNRLRFQAFSSLAFGAQSIIWACYTGGAWWYNNVLDDAGQKTPQYDKLVQVNRELRTLAQPYMACRNVATHFVGFAGENQLRGVSQSPCAALDTGVFRGLHAKNGENLLVGQMVHRSGAGHALLVCAADDPMDEHPARFTVEFEAGAREIHALDTNGENPLRRTAESRYAFELGSNTAVLIMAQ